MTTSVKIIADSISPDGIRLTTVEITAPYVIWPQMLTHRVFSRNAQSNRAFPTKKLIQRILANPYNPVFKANKPGMVAGKPVNQFLPRIIWSLGRRTTILATRLMNWVGVHKETTNRLLAPFMHITAVITATEWDNFFTLRIEDNAQPEIQELATKIRDAMIASGPRALQPGEWHLPYVSESIYPLETLIKLSVARCARVSYLNHDNSFPEIQKDLGLYEDLITSKPVHGSPAEHQATPMLDCTDANLWTADQQGWSNNFRGWKQFRATL